MTTLDGKAIDHLKGAPFIISNKACHETVLKILNANGGYQNTDRYSLVIKMIKIVIRLQKYSKNYFTI